MRNTIIKVLVGAGIATGIWLFVGIGAGGGLREQLRGSIERAERAERLGAGALDDIRTAENKHRAALDLLAERDSEVGQLRDELAANRREVAGLRADLKSGAAEVTKLRGNVVASTNQARRATELLIVATSITAALQGHYDS